MTSTKQKNIRCVESAPTFLVESILAAKQPTIIGGPAKTLKTTIALDLAVSLATGTPFLGRFKTKKSRVGFFAGNTDAFVLRSAVERITKARGVGDLDDDLSLSLHVPELYLQSHIDALGEVITKEALDVVFVDPLWFCFAGAGPENLTDDAIWEFIPHCLQSLNTLTEDLGVTFVLVHHFPKLDEHNPPPAPLEMMEQDPAVRWAKQWILLEQRRNNTGNGKHSLAMRTGGNSGHAGLWSLDVDEGVLDCRTMDGRKWNVRVTPTK